ncbi:MAG: bifunctional 3-deoxy-7-phosphoheptulonate synthase/chorismate mutase type II [Bacteroidales bacterium]|nr:bifunctional 3-deoxy-7-phosphoheptulonate synthase/chorismate mutase type II [Bacteroidales bacterium]
MEHRDRPIIIAGPCSAESRGQLREATEAISSLPQVKMIRAGVWKPRTRPGGFEGMGEEALQWMQVLTKEFGVEYCCEVARPEHVALCQRYGIRAVWLGARTTGNPFMVEEICEAMRGSGMEVMVKNPMSPDLKLWVGAVERVQLAGAQEVMAVHRGFDVYNNEGLRNAPMWELALRLRRELPEVPLLCDPSHLGGSRERVEALSLAAMQLGYDGLMVEVHPHPTLALTDAAQQLTPGELATLLDNIKEQKHQATDAEALRLTPLRRQMDDVDHELLRLLGRRMELSREIAGVKRETGMSVYQSKRWEEVLADRLRLAETLGLDSDFVRELLEKIHGESVRVQMKG